MTTDALQSQFSETLQAAADDVWSRFREVMPKRYFRETDLETQLSHLHVLTACQASGVEQEMVIRSKDGDTWTFLTGKSSPGQLGKMLDRLPKERSLTSARAYTSTDGQWVLDIFELGEIEANQLSKSEFSKLFEHLSKGLEPSQRDSYKNHLKGCPSEYLRAVPPSICQTHFGLVNLVKQSGDLVIRWEAINTDLDTVRLTVEGTEAKIYFQRVASYLGEQGIDIERAYVTSFTDGIAPFRYLGFTVRGAACDLQNRISTDLKRLYFVEHTTLDLWTRMEGWTLEDCEIVDFLVTLCHQILCGKDPVKYARSQLIQAAVKHPALMLEYTSHFRAKEASKQDLTGLEQDVERNFFHTCSHVLEALLEHNLAQTSRQALGARLKPELFKKQIEEVPYAVLFARGRNHQGFHVRFQDVARGGMRLICPRGDEAHTQETERLFHEAYSLARAQHLKNKDIPEGGAKAAVLVQPGADTTFCGKCFANTLLDLTVGLGCNEKQPLDLIYLGPDENVSVELIEWIAKRAALRGHPLPSAFMSSKPGAGINHKEFGITSEGVTVFLEQSLRQIGIDPRTDPFTVKITGGPDGDVAGNEIRILLERYPTTAKIVGVGDGSGVAEDPNGLDPEELLRLFDQVRPIAEFSKTKLGPAGRVVSVAEPAGVQLRNSLHNRLVTDAFVPAGGRPATINSENWTDFLTPDGKPSSRLIVEGANLFLTNDARQALSGVGVSIIKDSSANKCGVICSSFEVLASMLLTESEFLGHKQEFVKQVIDRLRFLALCEAELLFREHKRRPDLNLPTLSVRLSQVMLKTAEAVAQASVDPLEDDHGGTKDVLVNYLPPLLRELAADRLHQIPRDYRQRIVACSLSGKIVYREGITYLEDLPAEALCELALTYLRGEKVIRNLIDEVRASGLRSSETLAELLELGGARTLAESPLTFL